MKKPIPDKVSIKDSLHINVLLDNNNNQVILSLNGFLDTYNSIEFIKFTNEIIADGFINVILDCEELNYVASSGVGSFTSIQKNLNTKKGIMALTNLQVDVLNLFKILKLDSYLRIFKSIEEAQKSIRSQSS